MGRLSETKTCAVTQFGPGYAAAVQDVELTAGTHDEVVFAPDGRELVYRPGDERETNLMLALETPGESHQFQIDGADIGGGQAVTMTVDVAEGQLACSHAQAGDGNYDLALSRVSPAGSESFLHGRIDISASDTHYIDYGTWDGSGPMTLHIDRGSDGTLDETLVLWNWSNRIFLPLVVRNE